MMVGVSTTASGRDVAGRPARLALAATLVLSVVVLFSPGSTVPAAPSHTDKVIHLLLFGALAVTARWAGGGAGRVLGWLAVYAVASELAQAVVPIGRAGGVADALTDVVGAVLGVALVEGVRRARAVLAS